jgi:glycosyltransferase involved in cell wall biosynthesis
MEYCNERRIPAVYMLDDNWFSVGREWPEYAGLFTPGAPFYEHFLYCLKRADHVLTYNEVLAEDLRPHCRAITVLPTNIDLSLFPKMNRPRGGRPRVGYVGSLRKEDSAFVALSELTTERDDFDVFVMSLTIPEALKSLPERRLVYQPYVFGYRRYARVLCASRPDILLAPLESTRTDASKCPNKYLEITAAGAVGIYSNTAPYDRFVAHGRNGILVNNEVAEWKSAIRSLLDDPGRRAAILPNAEQDVAAHFNTPAVLPLFRDFLLRAVDLESGGRGVAP